VSVRLKPHPEGVFLTVRAQSGAKKDAITGEHDGALKVTVTQSPRKALVKVIADALGLRMDRA
jgi:uncharacterized protein YggU (UPF0235/DUF167 family)